MSHTSAGVLEFEGLRDLLRGYTASPLGQARLAALSPTTDAEWIANQQQLTAEIREFRRVGGRFDFSGLSDVSAQVEKSKIVGATLETDEIRNVIAAVDRASEWHQIVLSPPAAMRSDWLAVAHLSAAIVDFSGFLRGFHNKILPDGTLDDRASPELARIRREME
ncbi:MAG: endonuclease MutS2, partial [Acidobacteriales bacterium]|nr:endonuclease MutS2 [Terriglobales bacterium]